MEVEIKIVKKIKRKINYKKSMMEKRKFKKILCFFLEKRRKKSVFFTCIQKNAFFLFTIIN